MLDCEAVAWDIEQKKLLPFQILSTRKRKDVSMESIKVHIVLFAFDLLYLNGQASYKAILYTLTKHVVYLLFSHY